MMRPGPDAPIRIRPARGDEAAALTALAHRSKAVWGYDAAFMRAAAPDLTLTPERIAAAPACVAEHDGRLAGFYTLSPPGEERQLTHLFVEPALLRRGIGRALWDHAVAGARAAGWDAFDIEADPDAEPFYRRMGARRIGTARSIVSPDRRLPLLRMTLDTATPVAPERSRPSSWKRSQKSRTAD